MKLYVFIIMTLGLMFTFYMAGIDTGSNLIFQRFSFNDTSIDVNPNVSTSDVGTYSKVRERLSGATYFYILMGFFAVIALFSIARFSAFTISWQPLIEGGYAALSVVLWAIFSIDVYSTIKYTGELTDYSGWVYNLIFITLLCYLALFSFALIKFIRTGE